MAFFAWLLRLAIYPQYSSTSIGASSKYSAAVLAIYAALLWLSKKDKAKAARVTLYNSY